MTNKRNADTGRTKNIHTITSILKGLAKVNILFSSGSGRLIKMVVVS